VPSIPWESSEDGQTGGITGVVGDLWPPQIGSGGGVASPGGEVGLGSGSGSGGRPRPPNGTGGGGEKPTDNRPPIVEMEEEDEYDYDIYDEAESGFGDDVAPRPPSPSPPSGNPGFEDDVAMRPPPSGNPGEENEEEEVETQEEYEVVSGSIFQCPAPGFYPHEDNCREFYVCQEVLPGKLLADQLYRCPDRYLFDDETRRCQREHRVTCRKFGYTRRPYLKQTVLVVLERYLREFFSTPLRYDRNVAAIYGK